jgi:hypothetical protein
MFKSAGFSLMRAIGFSCSLDVQYGGLGIHLLQLLIKKYEYILNLIRVETKCGPSGKRTVPDCTVHFLSSNCAGFFKQSMGSRNLVGIGLSYRPCGFTTLHVTVFL